MHKKWIGKRQEVIRQWIRTCGPAGSCRAFYTARAIWKPWLGPVALWGPSGGAARTSPTVFMDPSAAVCTQIFNQNMMRRERCTHCCAGRWLPKATMACSAKMRSARKGIHSMAAALVWNFVCNAFFASSSFSLVPCICKVPLILPLALCQLILNFEALWL